MKIFMGVILLAWGMVTYALYKKRLTYFGFLLGSIGGFIFSIYFLREPAYEAIAKILTTFLAFIGNATNSFVSYIHTSTVTVFRQTESLSIFISYECSGVIELFVFINLLLFIPMYKTAQKAKYLFIGISYIIGSNLIRLLYIIYSTKMMGNDFFFLNHIVIGRILYFALIIALYYVIFTKPHIKLKKEGVTHAS